MTDLAGIWRVEEEDGVFVVYSTVAPLSKHATLTAAEAWMRERYWQELGALREENDDGESSLLSEDDSEIKLVPAAARDAWFRRSGKPYTREDFERDRNERKETKLSRGGGRVTTWSYSVYVGLIEGEVDAPDRASAERVATSDALVKAEDQVYKGTWDLYEVYDE